MKTRKILLCCLALFLSAGFLLANETITARRAFREKLEKQGPAAVIDDAMRSPDFAIRRYALARLYEVAPDKAVAYADKALDDDAPEVRKLAALLLGPHLDEKRTAKLRSMAERDADQYVRWAASAALWSLHRKNVLLKDDKSWDHLVKQIGTFDFPAAGWKVCDDTASNGHWRGFGSAECDDSSWRNVNAQSFAQKKGVQWYRVHFTPTAPQHFNAFEIVLPDVKGKCFVWLNGIYLGQRLEEAAGEVRLDATNEITPGKDNVLSVRVEASDNGGLTKNARGEWME